MDRNITETNHLKNTLTLLAVMVMVIATLLTACSSGTSQPANAEKETTQVKEETTEVKEVAEVEPTAEPTPEPAEEPKQAASLEEYIAQLDPNEICVVVWNENTNRQENFTEDQKCIVEEGDIVVVPVGERPIMSVYYKESKMGKKQNRQYLDGGKLCRIITSFVQQDIIEELFLMLMDKEFHVIAVGNNYIAIEEEQNALKENELHNVLRTLPRWCKGLNLTENIQCIGKEQNEDRTLQEVDR